MQLFRHFLPHRLTRCEPGLAYLNDAVSPYDLERREREVAAGKFAG